MLRTFNELERGDVFAEHSDPVLWCVRAIEKGPGDQAVTLLVVPSGVLGQYIPMLSQIWRCRGAMYVDVQHEGGSDVS